MYKNSLLIQICVFKIVQKYIIRTVDSHYVLTLIPGIFSLCPTRIYFPSITFNSPLYPTI